jgi:hypothetical protein
MHSYVVVAAKPGRPMPAHILELLDQPCPADLAFNPRDHVRWTDTRGRVAFGGWQAADAVDIGSHWHVDERGITAFSGCMWPHGAMWSGGQSWAHRLDEQWRARPPDKAGQPYDGIFTATSLNADGTGEIITDPLSAAMMYRAESNDVVAYSPRPGLAARAVAPEGQEPARDAIGSCWMIYAGYLLGDRTGFERVRVLPLGSYVELHPRFGSRVRTANPTPWINPDGLPDDPGELVDLVHRDLAQRVESIAKLPTGRSHHADITGGRDSRLILALLVESGLTDRFQFSTIGGDDVPDAIVGRELAELCALHFESIDPAPMPERDFLRRLQIHAFHTAGMANTWDLQGGVGVAPFATITGLFGECMSTHYSDYPRPEAADEFLDQYLPYAVPNADSLGILKPEASARYRQWVVEDLVERVDAESGLAFDRLDVFFVRNRLRRWSGTLEEIGHKARFCPLYSLVALQAGFALGPTRRRNEYLHFHLMRDACPMLAEHRFAGRGWRDGLLAGVADGHRYDVAPCTPPIVRKGHPTPQSWQGGRFERHRDIVEAYLLNEPASPLFEVVDGQAVIEALDGDFPPGFQPRFQIFGALAAAMWLGHHELALRAGTPNAGSVSTHPLPPEEPPPPPPPPPPGPWSRARSAVRSAPAPIREALRACRRAVLRIRRAVSPSAD